MRTRVERDELMLTKPMRTGAGIVMVLGAMLLGGCGLRGSLDAPEEAKAVGEGQSAQAGAAGTNSAAPPKPHRPFLLDGLLR